MGTIQQAIESKLAEALSSTYIDVVNESDSHSGPPGRESHFKVTLVTSDFDGVLPVKRHQAVYGILAEEMAGEVHALALHLYSPDEWEKTEAAPDSPNCLGGSR